MQTVILEKNKPRENAIARLIRFLAALPDGKSYSVEIKERKRTRSLQQNAFLWMTYDTILKEAPEELQGWTRDDLHEFFLIDHFGHEVLEGFGRKRLKPLKRSSKLSTVEFMEFVAHIQQFMAERGVYLPDPNEELSK